MGVPAAGPADPDAMRLANRLVGNPDDAAAIEITARRAHACASRCHPPGCGGAGGDPDGVELRVDGRPVAAGAVVPVDDGQSVAIGRVRAGLRAYLAVGRAVSRCPPCSGRGRPTCSADWVPPPLAAGDRLGLGAPSRPHGWLLPVPAPPLAGRHREVRVLPGPHRLAGAGCRRLLATTWAVGDESNRIGVRLVPAPERTRSAGSVEKPETGRGRPSSDLPTPRR